MNPPIISIISWICRLVFPYKEMEKIQENSNNEKTDNRGISLRV